MYSKNWGYNEFSADVEQTFNTIFTTHNFVKTNSTDEVSYVNFKSKKATLYIACEDSKVVTLIFKTPNGEEYNIETCCVIKNVLYKIPICKFRDKECIHIGLTYMATIVLKYFEQELQGNFNYDEEYLLLKEELYFINKQIAFLPVENPFYEKIKNNYQPGARVKLMRIKLVTGGNYPEKFQNIFNKYLKTKQS